jgi:hypothetical protein
MFNIRQLYTIVETVFNENLKLNELISFYYSIVEEAVVDTSSIRSAIKYILLFIGFAVGIAFVIAGLRDLGVQI